MQVYMEKEKSELKIQGPYFEIEGGVSLDGQVTIPGAKNAAIPALVAACLSNEEVTLTNVPIELNDVRHLINLLKSSGAKITIEGESVICSGRDWKGGVLDSEVASKIRHSLLLLGASANWGAPLCIPMPGGCSIGNRKHDLHIDALNSLGFNMKETDIGLELEKGNLNTNSTVSFHYPTFGGTLNVLFASVQAVNSETILKNAAKNPEVLDVINLLNNMGAKIEWIEQNTLKITGVEKLHGTEYMVMSDRIIASTLISAVGITKGKAFLRNATTKVLVNEVETWRKAGLYIEEVSNGILVEYKQSLKPVDITTEAYPGFHTDIQPFHTILMMFADGVSEVRDTILDGRFLYCEELNKLGANINVKQDNYICVNGAKGQVAIINGVSELTGTEVKATDIRGGAALAVAALVASGTTIITNIYQIERGYSDLPGLLTSLGAKIEKKGH